MACIRLRRCEAHLPSLTFPRLTAFVLSWTLLDTSGNPINNATATATLYSGRSLRTPDSVPGTPLSPIVSLNLGYVPASAGLYSANISATLDPPLNSTFILVVDASIGSTPVYHSETPVAISGIPNVVDLTTLTNVKSRYTVTTTVDDSLIQYLITSASIVALRETGYGPSDWTIPATGGSPLNSPCSFTENYDGNGSPRMFLRNQPIRSVQALTINGVSISASTGFGAPGYVIDQNGKSLSLRGGGAGSGGPFTFTGWGGSAAGYYFSKGIQNVSVQYTAGFDSTPFDLQDGVEILVGVNYRRAPKREQASIAMAQGAGTIAFRDWEIPPEVLRTFRAYRRSALV